jgi:predicted kinase
VRSDIERKRLHGLAARESSDSPVGGGIYDEHGNDATYDRLYAGAEAALSGGINLIVDAAFLNRARRRRFADLAAQYGAHFVILNCTAPETVLRERIAHREADREEVSEAGVAVLEAQLASADAPDAAESEYIVDVDTTQAPDPRALAGTITARGEVNAGLVPI